MKNIVIVGNYGSTNLGDELILLGLLKAIFEENPEAKVTIPSALPEETEKLTRFYFPEKTVKAVPRIPFGFRSFLNTSRNAPTLILKPFQEADQVILGGGGLLADDESILTCPFWYTQCLPAFYYKKPFKIYGIGVGPFRGRLAKWVVKKLVEKAKSVSTRDKISKVEIEKICPGKDIEVVEDPIFFLDENFFNTSFSARLRQAQPDIKKPYITLSLRKYRGWNEDLYKTFAHILDFIIEDLGLQICFLPFQTYPLSDLEILNKIIVHVKNKDHIFYPTIEPKNILQNLNMTFRLIKKSQFMLGMRLHSNLFASIMKTPFLPILYSQKSKAFLREHTPFLEDLALFFPDISLEEACLQVKRFFNESILRQAQDDISTKIYSGSKSNISQPKFQIS